MATNRYRATCDVCGLTVPRHGGNLRKVGGRWLVTHLACEAAKPGGASPVTSKLSPVIEIRIGGNAYTRNRAGRCIDAPCCGC